jgi:hypothetical protein
MVPTMKKLTIQHLMDLMLQIILLYDKLGGISMHGLLVCCSVPLRFPTMCSKEHITDHGRELSCKGELIAKKLEKNKHRELQVDKDGNSENRGLTITNRIALASLKQGQDGHAIKANKCQMIGIQMLIGNIIKTMERF